jgi:hypothetical protein
MYSLEKIDKTIYIIVIIIHVLISKQFFKIILWRKGCRKGIFFNKKKGFEEGA